MSQNTTVTALPGQGFSLSETFTDRTGSSVGAPSGTTTYYSDCLAVATVDASGNVSCVAPGDAVITITKGNSSGSIKVIVQSAPAEVDIVIANTIPA